MEIRLEPLGRHHDRAVFSCGKSQIDRFLRETAMQRQERGFAHTTVALEAGGSPTRIVGFFCTLLHEFRNDELSERWREITKAGTLQTVPAMLLAQLGVDTAFQRRGVGDALLMAVFRRAVAVTEMVGCAAIVTDPIDEIAARFYAGADFQPLRDGSARMIVAMKTVVSAIAELDER